MNITLVCDRYLPNIGGVELTVYHLSREFAKKGHHVIIIANRDPSNLASFEMIDEIPVNRLYFVVPRLKVKQAMATPILAPISIAKMISVIKENNSDIIALQFVSSNALYATISKRILKIPLVSTIQGNDVQKFPLESRTMNWIFKNTLKNSEFVTGCSASLLSEAERMVPEIQTKSVPIPNGVDIGEIDQVEPYKPDKPYIFSAGRFVYKKGFDILIKAFKDVANVYPNINLKIAGYGPEKDNLVTLIRKLRIDDKAEIVDKPNRRQLIQLLKGSEFFILPSRREAFGIVNLEAMSAKKAVVATAVDGVPEIIKNNVNGILVKPEDSLGLAKGILTLLENPSLSRNLGSEGRKIVETNYSWNIIADKYLNLYKKLERNG